MRLIEGANGVSTRIWLQLRAEYSFTLRTLTAINTWKSRALAVSLFASAVCCALGAVYEPSNLQPPRPMREYRAAWVASVGNIDWPSQKGLNTSEQKAELLAILNRAAQLRLNTIV